MQFINSKFQGASEYIFFAALSKLLAAVTTYPYQVVRARLQDQNGRHSRALECIRDTYRYVDGLSMRSRSFPTVPNMI